MTIVAHAHPFVVGVDTHARNHVLAILTGTGEVIDTREFPTTSAGLARAIAWVARRTGGDLAVLWVIEGVASYGAGLTGAVERAGFRTIRGPGRQNRPVVHAGRPAPAFFEMRKALRDGTSIVLPADTPEVPCLAGIG